MLDEKNGGIHSPRYLSLHFVFDVKPSGSGITPVWAWPPRPQPGTCSSKLVSGRSWNVQLVEVDEAGLYRFRYVRWTCCASIISPVTRCFSCVSSDQLYVKCFFLHWLHMACFSVSGPLISLIPLSLFQQGCFFTLTPSRISLHNHDFAETTLFLSCLRQKCPNVLSRCHISSHPLSGWQSKKENWVEAEARQSHNGAETAKWGAFLPPAAAAPKKTWQQLSELGISTNLKPR